VRSIKGGPVLFALTFRKVAQMTDGSLRLRSIAQRVFLIVGLLATLGQGAAAQEQQRKKEPATPGPMLDQGIITLDTPDFTLQLVRSSQTVAALKPKIASDFDFTPGDLLIQRSKDGYYHLGDLDLRVRSGDSGEWKNYSTSTARKPVAALPASGEILVSADLSPTLPADIPLQISRSWVLEQGKLVLRFALKNKTAETIQS